MSLLAVSRQSKLCRQSNALSPAVAELRALALSMPPYPPDYRTGLARAVADERTLRRDLAGEVEPWE